MEQKRPNILLITTDQQRYDHLGLKGVQGIETPTLDRLGREGVHFDRAYTPCPLCTPARVSMLTGQYPSTHGAYSIGVTADPFPSPTLAELLGGIGYDTALFGKTHFVQRADEPAHVAGFPDPTPAFFRTHTGPYLGFNHVQVCRGHTTNAAPDMHYRAFLEKAGVDYAAWYPDVEGQHDHDATGFWNIPAEYHDTAWVGNNTVEWLRGQAEAKDQPWFCWTSFQDPHEPFVCPDPWYSRVRRDELQLYEGPRPGEFNDKPAFYREALAADNWGRFVDESGIPVPSVFTRPKVAETALDALQATLGMIAFIDDRVGAIMQTLEETGQAKNTVVLFTTDHGEIHGHHGFWHKGLMPYDDCQRIPFLVWGPNFIRPIGTTQAIASLVDIPRTILSLCDLETPQGMQGSDLSPILRGHAETVNDWAIIEVRATAKVYQQTFITQRYKLIVYKGSEEAELYDLEQDPDQYVNLWNRPGHERLKTELLHRFVQANMEKDGHVRPRTAFA